MDLWDESRETKLRRRGQIIARNKLDKMTRHGERKLCYGEWQAFFDCWKPQFEALSPKEFKGREHYIDRTDWPAKRWKEYLALPNGWDDPKLS